MDILFDEKCRSDLNHWLERQYSPLATNAEKIFSNLKHIGHPARKEWAESFDIICDAFGWCDLLLVHELIVERVRCNAECQLIIDLSFTMFDDEVFYGSFMLDRTLNILQYVKNNENIQSTNIGSTVSESMSASWFSSLFFSAPANIQSEKNEMTNEQDPQAILRETLGVARA